MSLTTTFDDMVTRVAQVQCKTEALMDKLLYVNSYVQDGEPDRGIIEETLHELLLDLPDLNASAAASIVACAAFAAEVVRLPPSLEEDSLHGTDGSATGDAGSAAQAAAASLACADVIARTH